MCKFCVAGFAHAKSIVFKSISILSKKSLSSSCTPCSSWFHFFYIFFCFFLTTKPTKITKFSIFFPLCTLCSLWQILFLSSFESRGTGHEPRQLCRVCKFCIAGFAHAKSIIFKSVSTQKPKPVTPSCHTPSFFLFRDTIHEIRDTRV